MKRLSLQASPALQYWMFSEFGGTSGFGGEPVCATDWTNGVIATVAAQHISPTGAGGGGRRRRRAVVLRSAQHGVCIGGMYRERYELSHRSQGSVQIVKKVVSGTTAGSQTSVAIQSAIHPVVIGEVH